VIAYQVLPTQPELPFATGMEAITRVLQGLSGQKSASIPLNLLGIGIACTGQVDPLEGTVLRNGFLPTWVGQNPSNWLDEQFGLQVALENDADAAALAEWRLGAGQGAQRFVYITVSTGIGGGLIFSGQLYRGANGVHPEIGHHTIDPDGPTCFCGNRGCWEMFASGPALHRRFQALRPVFTGDARQVCDLAEAGDALAQRAVQAHAEMLGIGLANLITLYAPDVIALGGGLMRRANLFMPVIQETIPQRSTLVPPGRTRLALCQFAVDSSLIGAAMVWEHRYSG
jgi:glucokinase